MYNFKNLFKQSPETLKVAVLAVAGCIAGALGKDPSIFETLGYGLALERLLHLFWVAPQNAAREEATALQGIELGKQLQGARRRS